MTAPETEPRQDVAAITPTLPPTLPPPQPAAAAPAAARDYLPDAEPTGFYRLWTAFMSARMLVALALLLLHVSLYVAARGISVLILLACLVYTVLTVAVRVMARPRGPGRPFDGQWLYTLGVDIGFFIVLQAQAGSGLNYTPLLALPVLMAAILGSRALALGTALLVLLLLLGQALWVTDTDTWRNTIDIGQAAVAGVGLLLLALVTHQLAARLAREEGVARRSRAEAQVQAMVNDMVIEALIDGVLVVDEKLLVRVANPAARRMLGSDQEVTPDQFRLDDNPAWAQLVHIAEVSFSSGPVDFTEVTLHHEDRHSSHLQVRTQRTPTVGVGVGGRGLCVIFLQDLREMQAQMRTEKLAAMGRMSAAVAHEIRNPLAAITQANALLEEDLSSPAHQRLTAMVRQNAQRLGHIVDDVLDIVRVQGQGSTGATEAIELDELIAGFAEEWALQNAAGQRLQIELQAPEVHVQFAHEHLRRILVNLLDNAARYASQRPGAIQIITRSVRHGPAMLMVWSDGPPIEPSVQRHLFEPFFSSESRSSGLGLFICRELCERHGASIAHERTTRDQAGQAVEGNEFFVSFRRAHGPHSILELPNQDDEHP